MANLASISSKEVLAGNTVSVTVRVRPPSLEKLIENRTKLGKLILFFKEGSQQDHVERFKNLLTIY